MPSVAVNNTKLFFDVYGSKLKILPTTVEEFEKRCVPYYANNAYSQEEIARCQQNTAVFQYYCKYEMKTFNYLEQLHKIQCPSLFMIGADSPGHPPAAAEEMIAKVRADLVTKHLFNHAGAPVYKDSPEESYQVVRQFLQKLIS
ncbi:MAG: alpha/beta hydrolase [Gammaproteobacteria bacterium]|nr:alpha/beta hydrolase [Gammaproteobacteria bacterium]